MIISHIKKTPIKALAATALLCLIGFQQFPIIKIGGSFKIYELLSVLILVVDIITIKKLTFASYITVAAFLFFVVSPIISFLYANIVLGYPGGFFLHYGSLDSIKFNFYVFPLLQLIYMFFNFSAFNEIAISKFIYIHLDKILKAIVIIGTGIALYSILAIFGIDIVTYFPSFIQDKHFYVGRSTGFSQEPSFYVMYQSWVCVILWYTKALFKYKVWLCLLAVNIASLLFTFSSTLVGLALIILLSVFIFKSTYKAKITTITIIGVLLLAGFFLIYYYQLTEAFNYIFFSKIQSFLSTPEYTTDSGSFRSYTNAIGIRIFKDHWLTGVGVGNSIYYMYLYEYKMGIQVFGETLFPGSFPQNLFSMILSEQGIIGGGLISYFLISLFRKFWINRNKTLYSKMFLSGFLFNVIAMFTIAPTYSLFIWVFIALGLNYTLNTFYNTQLAN